MSLEDSRRHCVLLFYLDIRDADLELGNKILALPVIACIYPYNFCKLSACGTYFPIERGNNVAIYAE